MISYDFEYFRPETIEEATQLFHMLVNQGKNPIYFSGGTEIITLGRLNQIVTDAVIDIKAIPACNVLKKEDQTLILGAALSLTKIRETQRFPFLSKTIAEIADNTARNKITLGGNICSNIIYRETILPLLLTESRILLASRTGMRQQPISDLFEQKLQLDHGDLLVQVMTEQSAIDLPFLSIKKRRQWDVGYPLITTAALKKDRRIKVAFSGLCAFPFRDEQMEAYLNNLQLSMEERVKQAIQHISAPILEDAHGSAEYRLFVLENTLLDVLNAFEMRD